MLKLRTIGLSDYSVLEGRQRIGRIRLATERMPCVCPLCFSFSEAAKPLAQGCEESPCRSHQM